MHAANKLEVIPYRPAMGDMKTIRNFLKTAMTGACFGVVSPLGLLSRMFFLLQNERFFQSTGAFLSLFPGRIGSALRVAFYQWTLRQISVKVNIGFGSFFSKREAVVGKNVYIGGYCILGSVHLGDDIIIASRVSIPSGRRQHPSTIVDGKRCFSDYEASTTISVGDRTWIGEGAIVMADVGNDCIVGAGSVVTRAVPDGTLVGGNPARPLERKAFSPSNH